MNNMAWIIDPKRTMSELQQEATARQINTNGLNKHAILQAIVDHEVALQVAAAQQAQQAATPTPITPTPVAPITPVQPAPVVTPAPIGGAPAGTPPPAQPTPVGWHYEWHRNILRRGHYVLVEDPTPGTPAPATPAPHRQVDFGPLAFLLGVIGILALAALILFFVLFPAANWGWNHSPWGSDNNTVAVKTGGDSGNGGSNTNTDGNVKTVKVSDNVTGNAVNNVTNWQVPTPPSTDLNNSGFTKVTIDNAAQGKWNHRVFDPSLFDAAHNWGGGDSWFNTLMVGPNSGGFWTSFGNTGEVIYRGNTTHISWCLADLTTSDYKAQFLSRGNPSLPAAMNIRITPNSIVSVKTNSGKVISQNTSDGGDITIILPDSGTTSACVDYTTAAPTHESHVWFGPYDRSQDIDTIDASK